MEIKTLKQSIATAAFFLMLIGGVHGQHRQSASKSRIEKYVGGHLIHIYKADGWFDTGIQVKPNHILHITNQDGSHRIFNLRLDKLNATSLPDDNHQEWGIHTLYFVKADFDDYRALLNQIAWSTVPADWTDIIKLRIDPREPSSSLTLKIEIQDVSNSRSMDDLGVLNTRAVILSKPRYPEQMIRAGATGRIVIDVIVDELGNVVNSLTMQQIPKEQMEIWKAAFRAVKDAKFRPYVVNGRAKRFKGQIVYAFP